MFGSLLLAGRDVFVSVLGMCWTVVPPARLQAGEVSDSKQRHVVLPARNDARKDHGELDR